ncbi:YIP1 family protein [Tepidibacillus marianensis]|uniref:YIP1 family protein n=1 Tax=Tepidibacillus marianensis TaxID=3131995 RepID=UPI0030CFF64D
MEIITSPIVQFERMKEKAPIGLPLVIMLVLIAITSALVSYVGLKNPTLSELEIEIPVAFTVAMGVIGGLFGGAATFFITAAFYKTDHGIYEK